MYLEKLLSSRILTKTEKRLLLNGYLAGLFDSKGEFHFIIDERNNRIYPEMWLILPKNFPIRKASNYLEFLDRRIVLENGDYLLKFSFQRRLPKFFSLCVSKSREICLAKGANANTVLRPDLDSSHVLYLNEVMNQNYGWIETYSWDDFTRERLLAGFWFMHRGRIVCLTFYEPKLYKWVKVSEWAKDRSLGLIFARVPNITYKR